jgi:hypothetical protein
METMAPTIIFRMVTLLALYETTTNEPLPIRHAPTLASWRAVRFKANVEPLFGIENAKVYQS